MEEVLKNSPLIKRILEDDEFESQRELVNSMISIKLLGLIKYLQSINYSLNTYGIFYNKKSEFII